MLLYFAEGYFLDKLMEETGVRDNLALERTLLANERTFLAYVRTSLSLLAGGAVMLQFFPENLPVVASAWFLVVAGGAALVVGLRRFLSVRVRLKNGD